MKMNDEVRNELVMGGGLLTATGGIALLSLPYALIAFGGTLFALGCIGVLRRRK